MGAYARNLIETGEQVIGVDPAAVAREGVAEPGLWIGDCDLVILSLSGLIKPGRIVLEIGTFVLADKEAARQTLAESGTILLDCPVIGTGAQAGSL